MTDHSDEGARAGERLRLLETCMARSNDQIVISEVSADPTVEPRIVYANAAFERATGYALADVTGRGMSLLRDSHANGAAERQISESLGRGQSARVEMVARRKDGSTFWVDLEATPIFGGPLGISHILTISRDITERRQADARLRAQAALLDAARDAIYVREPDGRIRHWNKSAERAYGWREDEAVGKNVRELLCRESDKFDAANVQLAERGEWAGAMEHVTRDGRRLEVECRWTLVAGPGGIGDPASVLVIETDVTERRQLEARVLRGQRMESIGTLAGGMAHDLNNMLAPVLMTVDLLKSQHRDRGDAMLLESLDTIESSTRRGADLIRQVLAFARGAGGDRVPVDPRSVVREVARLLGETLPRQIDIAVDMPERVWSVVGDATQLHQVVMNLCLNARDAMPSGGRLHIAVGHALLDDATVALEPAARPGPFVTISVGDNGTGMSRAVLGRVFEPFFTTKPLGQGTGLGLATVQGIVQSHGGWVSAESELGQGSLFRVYLPAAEGGVEAATRTVAARPLAQGKGELVLLVDDEAAIRRAVGRMLGAAGYRVISAPNGAEALALFRAHRDEIAVVVTDMMMPVMDGPATIRALRAEAPDVRIIAASGLPGGSSASGGTGAEAAGGVERWSVVAGVSHFLMKPFDAEDLLGALRATLS